MKDPEKLNGPDIPLIPPISPEGEDILFPDDSDPSTQGKKITHKSSFVWRFIFGLLLIIGIFFLGYLTQPIKLEQAIKDIQSFGSLALEKAHLSTKKMDTKITEVMENNLPVRNKPLTIEGSSNVKEKTAQPESKIKFWQSPMNPSYVSDKPGKSPMGMDLIPIYEDPVGGNNGIRISPSVEQNIGLKTERVKTRALTRDIRTVGILTYDERKKTHIHTKYTGWIEKLHIDFTGKEVNEGDLLVEIYSPELVSTQEEFLLAMKYNQTFKDSPFSEIGTGAERLLQSTRRRLELFDVPKHQIETLIRDKKITKTLHIHSPFRGFVVKKEVSQGMFVKPGMSLYTIVDLSNIWVLADIYEYEMPWIEVGQQVEMNLTYYPGKKFTGKITYIDPFMDPKTRTLKVRMEFKNPEWKLKPDMYANVTLKSIIAKKSVAVPESAVIHSGEKQLVIVKTKKGNFKSREITLGAQAEGYYQVLAGLKHLLMDPDLCQVFAEEYT